MANRSVITNLGSVDAADPTPAVPRRAIGSSRPQADHERLIPGGVWRAVAVVCSPLLALASVTALSYPGFGRTFIVLSALIGLCLLVVLAIEKINGRYEEPTTESDGPVRLTG